MSEPFIGEIRIFPYNFAPRNWAFCDGQLLSIAQNTALFALLGTTYGGDGRTTFGLPNLQGRAAVHAGRGPGLSDRRLGATGGSPTVQLTQQQLPSHQHTAQCSSQVGDAANPQNKVIAAMPRGRPGAYSTTAPDVAMNPQALALSGGGQSHNNLPPYLVLNFCIALFGLFPPRN